VFGGLTPEKRIPQILAAFRATLPYAPDARLVLAGATAAHAELNATDYADVADRVFVTGYVADAELTDHVAAIDVSLNLRWPTARETSGPWLRALAAGKPTVITDLVHLTDVASLDPRTWTVRAADDRRPTSEARKDNEDRTSDLGPRTSDAVTVAIDILDEDHSLRLAMRRLAQDADLRARLGRAAREYWQREHSIEAMTEDYVRVLGVLGVREVRGVHGVHDGDEKLRALLEPFGIESPL
jgi:glycosyltransferase involved in cell wall biosynthesis